MGREPFRGPLLGAGTLAVYGLDLRVAEMLLHRPTERNDNNSKRGGGDRAHIPASFYRVRIESTRAPLAGVVELLEALPLGPLRDRLMNGEGQVVQKDLQRGILSYLCLGPW